MNINDASSSLRSAYIGWEGFLANPRFVRRDTEITWEDFKDMEFVDVVTASHVSDLAESGQYSFQVRRDGSIFQIHYVYGRTHKRIVGANLSFYLSGTYYLNDSDRSMIDEDLVPTPDQQVGWLRIDYDDSEQADGGAVHAQCHMHLGLFPNARITVDRVPNPKQFIEFVIASCYPEDYKAQRLDKRGRFADLAGMCGVNDPLTSELEMLDICKYATHLHIPTTTVPPMAA